MLDLLIGALHLHPAALEHKDMLCKGGEGGGVRSHHHRPLLPFQNSQDHLFSDSDDAVSVDEEDESKPGQNGGHLLHDALF